MIEIKEPNKNFKASLGIEVKPFVKTECLGGTEVVHKIEKVEKHGKNKHEGN